ncbi:invasion associated locus B family protein [Marinimicrococcus flavescens]|uniref:Invasion associated locus B family protein n=1 Tax=Marinimicrococcus flavescens TaxID=3031815 RepID=A0AAP3UX73_9PROT|nr:invasion associated locus B family protein [Marinimicrococcus flavescens]
MMRAFRRPGTVRGVILALAGSAFLGGAVPVRDADAQGADAQGSAAAAEAGASSKRTIQTFEAWTVTCNEGGQGRKACSMSQRLADPKTGRPIGAWNIGVDAEGRLVAGLRTPTLTALQAGVTLQVDERAPLELAYRTCAPAFCEVVLPLEDGLLRGLRAGATARVGFTDLARGRLAVPFSLKGFTRALETLEAEAAG